MALGLTVGGTTGPRTPFIKYDARAGRMFRVDRTQDSTGTWTSDQVDITNVCTFIADLANIKVGWIAFTEQGPSKTLVSLGESLPPRPDGKKADGKPLYQQGFEFLLILSGAAGGGPAREFGSSAGCVIEAVDALHTDYIAAPEAKAGKLPIVALKGVSPIKTGQSTNYRPQFDIVGWKDRPSGLVPSAAPAAPVAAEAPPVTGSTVVGPPAPQPAPAPVVALADDFG